MRGPHECLPFLWEPLEVGGLWGWSIIVLSVKATSDLPFYPVDSIKSMPTWIALVKLTGHKTKEKDIKVGVNLLKGWGSRQGEEIEAEDGV